MRECDEIEVIDFELKAYQEVLTLQETLFNTLVEAKRQEKKRKEYVLIGEHQPVITLGRRAKESNVLVSEDILKSKGIGVYHIGRGGDVTYHCPGQLIVYPIIELDKHHICVKEYVGLLEETVIQLLAKYGIKGERIEGATGVWIGKGSDNERKISAIGVKCSRYCTMHGLSLNIDSNLNGFTFINPCGFQNKGVTSMKKECEIQSLKEGFISIENVKKEFLDIFFRLIFPL